MAQRRSSCWRGKVRSQRLPGYLRAIAKLSCDRFCASLLFTVLLVAVASGQDTLPTKRVRLDLLISGSLAQSVNRADAIAALRIWADMIGKKRGFQMDTRIEVVDNLPEIRKRIQETIPGILSVDTVEYLQLADLKIVEPTFSSLPENNAPRHYLVLVRSDSGLNSLESLRGKSIIYGASSAANLGLIWSDSILYDARLGSPDRFFSSSETVTKASAAILPVFFGKADAAVVEGSAFDVMRELNPQIGKQVKVLLTSPQLIEGVLCVSSRQEYRAELLDEILKLHLDTAGRQILTVFRFGRLTPVDAAALDRVREMWIKHNRLTHERFAERTPEKKEADKPASRSGGRP